MSHSPFEVMVKVAGSCSLFPISITSFLFEHNTKMREKKLTGMEKKGVGMEEKSVDMIFVYFKFGFLKGYALI